MLIAQISDTHLTLDGPQGENRMRDLRCCVADLNALDPLPDLVVHSGDIVHNGQLKEYEAARQMLDVLRSPYVVMAGNKDDRAALLTVFADRTMCAGDATFVQYAVDTGTLQLIALDTLSGRSHKGDFCDRRLDHLEKLLADSQDRSVVIFMHHPPFDVAEIPDPFQFESRQAVSRLVDVLKQHPRIAGIFCGHVHRLTNGSVGDVPVSTVTSIAIDLRKGKYPSEARDRTIYQLHRFIPDGGFATETRLENSHRQAGSDVGRMTAL